MSRSQGYRSMHTGWIPALHSVMRRNETAHGYYATFPDAEGGTKVCLTEVLVK